MIVDLLTLSPVVPLVLLKFFFLFLLRGWFGFVHLRVSADTTHQATIEDGPASGCPR